MYQQVLNFVGIGILSAVLAVAAIIGSAMRVDKDPAVDGPRALIAEFFGLWIAFACLAWSFLIDGPSPVQWFLRGVAAVSAIFAFSLAAYFAGTPEVDLRIEKEPTGFEIPITAMQLHLHETTADENDSTANSRAPDRTWSGLEPQKEPR